MSTEFKEIIMPPHTLYTQHFRPDLSQSLFYLALRRFVCLLADKIRLWQRLAIYFAIRIERQLVQFNQNTGYHIVRQGLAKSFAY